jgi:hypothetical protein
MEALKQTEKITYKDFFNQNQQLLEKCKTEHAVALEAWNKKWTDVPLQNHDHSTYPRPCLNLTERGQTAYIFEKLFNSTQGMEFKADPCPTKLQFKIEKDGRSLEFACWDNRNYHPDGPEVLSNCHGVLEHRIAVEDDVLHTNQPKYIKTIQKNVYQLYQSHCGCRLEESNRSGNTVISYSGSKYPEENETPKGFHKVLEEGIKFVQTGEEIPPITQGDTLKKLSILDIELTPLNIGIAAAGIALCFGAYKLALLAVKHWETKPNLIKIGLETGRVD